MPTISIFDTSTKKDVKEVQHNLKPIEVIKLLNEYQGGELQNKVMNLQHFDEIQLLNRNKDENDLDLFMAWQHNKPNSVYIFIGHWNDGII